MSLLDPIRRLVRLRPLDWNHGAGRPKAERPQAIDVIIAVYGAATALQACLDSLAGETDLTNHRVFLVVDGPQEAAVEALVAEFAAAHSKAVRVLRNPKRLGFVGSVNRGMSESTTDVVLLNSDTVVTKNWIEKLADAAYSSGDVGTVTPLSNDATLCSVPRPFEANLLPSGFGLQSFAALVEKVAARRYPRIPTGVGVCLYIRRALLDDVGLFDTDRFGLGYGEENDFCLRALACGWLHVADDATFIYHAGHASFGESGIRLRKRARSTLRRIHPRYASTIAEFMRLDPLDEVRAPIAAALGKEPAAGRLRVVHLVHGWPPFQRAGTELYASWLVREQKRLHDVAVYARFSDPDRAEGEAVEVFDAGVRVRLVTNNFTSRNPLRRNALRDRALERDFERFLKDERPDLLHIHHLAGHAFSLAKVAQRLAIPIVLQIQDWWFLCARVNLFDRDGHRCTGPAAGKCTRCATLTKITPGSVTNRLLHVLRRSAARTAIEACDAYVVGSNAIRDDYVRAGLIPESRPIRVIPYGVDIPVPREPRPLAKRPIRFGYVGSIQPHKGVHTAVEAMRELDPKEATLQIWGDNTASPGYVEALKQRAGAAAVTFEGSFRENDKQRVFRSMDVLLVPSIGLESFGLAAREAMTCRVPVIATAGGALSEMFEPGDCGELFPAGDATALLGIMRSIVENPQIVDQWSARLSIPKRSDAHASEIERVYESVLAARKR